MRNDDIERVIDILKEQIPLSMKAHVKKIYIYGQGWKVRRDQRSRLL